MSWTRWMGSIAGSVLLAGCTSASTHVISRTAEVSPGVNIVRTKEGNKIDSVTMRRDATRANDLAVRGCLLTQVVPVHHEPAADVLQPEASTWQRQGNLSVEGESLHYRLSLQHLNDQNYYLFDQLGWSQDNGKASETWTSIPAWDNHQSKVVHDALVNKTNAVQECLVNVDSQQRSPAAGKNAGMRSS